MGTFSPLLLLLLLLLLGACDASTWSSQSSSSDSCDYTYGFIPCSTTWMGNLFLIIVYGYLMYEGATYLSTWSEHLLEIRGPGIVGATLVPILEALPDASLILASGLPGSTDSAQSQVSIGIGLIAGSTVMLLTIIWASCVFMGKCDILNNRTAIDRVDTNGVNLTSMPSITQTSFQDNLHLQFSLLYFNHGKVSSGVSTDLWTNYAARIMVLSVIPFLVVQIPQSLISFTSERRLAILSAFILSFTCLVSYCLYQVFQPWLQKRRISYVKNKGLVSSFLRRLRMCSQERFHDEEGRLDHAVLERLFSTIDANGDNYLTKLELRAFLMGTILDDIKSDEDNLVEKVMEDFGTDNMDSKISLDAFKAGVSKWFEDLKKGRNMDQADTSKFLTEVHEDSTRQYALLGGDDNGSDTTTEDDIRNRVEKITIKRAMSMLFVGAMIAGIFADLLVDAVSNFSNCTNIPTFYISFIFLPVATNFNVAKSAVISSRRKMRSTTSLTLSELYGAVTRSNVVSLPVFLGLVYIRELKWDFSSEVLIILIVCIIIGLLGSLRTTFPLWTSLVGFALYPLSLLLVYILDCIYGWS